MENQTKQTFAESLAEVGLDPKVYGSATNLDEAIRRGLCFGPAGGVEQIIENIGKEIRVYVRDRFQAGFLKIESESTGELDRTESILLNIVGTEDAND